MANPLQKIIDIGKSIFSNSSSGSAVGIDIGTSAIKIVEIKKKGGKAVLETYGSVSLGSYASVENGRVTNLPAEKIALALKEVLKESDVSTKSSALSISSQSSLIFTIEIPPNIKESSLSTIIPTEARKYIPVPITEVSLDWFILPKKEPSFEEENNPDLPIAEAQKTEVLVVAIENDAIAKYQSVVTTCSLDAAFFELEVFSSIRANFDHELSPVLLLDFGASKVKLSIVEFGAVKSFHIINRGGADITESISKSLSIDFPKAEEMKREFGLLGNSTEKNLTEIIKTHIDYVFSETNSVLLGYEKKYNKTISKVILTGGGSLLKGFKEMSVGNFPVQVEVGTPFSKVSAPVFLEKVLLATGPEFAVALGLALRKLQ
ncbi:MAG: type IV pilus assembly protein PilM [Candidatus Nomurabacteria bacterium]|nr:type IV pilus assembly protein PilM [Candidatus Nomurabacteria bacterium]